MNPRLIRNRSQSSMLMKRKHKIWLIIAGIYCFLWLLTGTWGISDIDQAFDRQYAVALDQVPIERIQTMNVRDIEDPTNKFPETDWFRYRSKGFAVCPFIVVDEAAAVWAGLAGFGGKRVCFWFFGFTHSWLVKAYWYV